MHEPRTPRLDLRPIGEGDASLYCRLYTDPGVMRHIAVPLSTEAAQRAFAAVLRKVRQSPPPLRVWVLVEREVHTEVGILALMHRRDRDDALELGAMLLAAAQGRGLAAEAQTRMLDDHFSGSACPVWSRNAASNVAAAAVRRKLGFVPDPAVVGKSGEMRWSMTRQRWQDLRAIRTGVADSSAEG